MIKIQLDDSQRKELEKLRFQSSSRESEKALMVLLADDGKKVPEISRIVKRNPHTVRDWLKRYITGGIIGLSRKFSPGRPATKREFVKARVKKLIKTSPELHGYTDTVWTAPLLAYDISEAIKESVNPETVKRALKDLGYSYKRPSKKTPDKLSRKEKSELVKKMVDEIEELIKREDSVVYSLDESHFSNEPYLARGWFFKRWPPQDRDPEKKRKTHILWLLEFENKKILLEKIE